jgi:hypothetical protein
MSKKLVASLGVFFPCNSFDLFRPVLELPGLGPRAILPLDFSTDFALSFRAYVEVPQ